MRYCDMDILRYNNLKQTNFDRFWTKMLLILIPGIFLTLDLHIYIDGDQPKYYQNGLA